MTVKDKKELDLLYEELRIEKKVHKQVKARCIAFWSVVSAVFGIIGGFIAENSTAAKAALKTFIDVWIQK